MARYVAFLRGVMPTNCKMPELKRAFERAGFTQVVTVLGSGNVVFDAKGGVESTLVTKAEAAMQAHLGRTFRTMVRSVAELESLLEADPFARFRVPAGAKQVVSFLPAAPSRVALPPATDGAQILAVRGREALTIYSPTTKGPVFMAMIEKTLGTDVTTRTWETVKKCVAAAHA